MQTTSKHRAENHPVNSYRFLTYSIVLSILGFGLWAAFEDYDRILASILLIGWQGFILVCVFSVLNYVLRYLRWIVLLRQFGDRFAFVDGLLCYVAAFALTTTPGKVGEAIRSIFFFRRHQIQHSHTLAALLSERIGDAVASVLLATMAVYTFGEVRWLSAAFTLMIGFVVLLVRKPTLVLRMTQFLSVIKLDRIQRFLQLIAVFLARTKELLSMQMFSMVTLVGLLSWSAEAYAFAWLALQLGGSEPVLLYMSIFALAMVAGAATFLPGGLGSTEAVMFLLLTLTGMDDAQAFTVALLSRLATLWLAVILGLMTMLWLESHPIKGSKVPSG